MLSNQEVAEANRLVKDLTSLNSKPLASAMYALLLRISADSFVFSSQLWSIDNAISAFKLSTLKIV